MPIKGGYIDVSQLAERPGLGVELDMNLVRSRPHQPLPSRRKLTQDGAAALY